MPTSKGEDSQTLIKTAALSLFLQFGFEKVSLNQIADQAGVSKGGLTHHFTTKVDLLINSVAFFFKKIQENSSESQNNFETLSAFIKKQFLGIARINSYLKEITGVDDTELNYHRLFLDANRLIPDFDMFEFYFKPSIDGVVQLLKNFQSKNELNSALDPKDIAFEMLAIMEGAYIIQFYDKNLDIENKMLKLADSYIRRLK